MFPLTLADSKPPCGNPDSAALMALFQATNGSNWTRTDGWGEDCDICSWYGISCNRDGRVVGINLYQNNLTGTLPVEVSNLDDLVSFELWRNAVGGTIPSEYLNMSNLIRLNLAENNLSGVIPAFGPNCNLQLLSLYFNNLSGSLPANLTDVSTLRLLDLNHNDLSGVLPADIDRLSNLFWLAIAFNNLSGSIPSSVGTLSSLVRLELNNNGLSGSIPSEIGNCTGLTELKLGLNNYSTTIPQAFGNLTKLVRLYLEDCGIFGTIPHELGLLTNLKSLRLNDNRLSGTLPPELGNLFPDGGWEGLRLQNNNLEGCFPATFNNLCQNEVLVATAGNPCFTSTTFSQFCIGSPCAFNDYTLGALPSPEVCEGITIQLVASGGSSYQWSTGESEPIISIEAMNDDIFYVTINTFQGCTRRDSLVITVKESPMASATGTDVSIAGASDGTASAEALGGSAPYSYVWSNGQIGPIITGLSSGSYQVTVTDQAGCEDTASVNIGEPSCLPAGTTCDDGDPQTFDDQEDGLCNCSGTPCPVIQLTVASTDLICHQDQSGSIAIAPGGGVAPYSFLWTGGQMTSTIMGLDTGSYSVTVTDANGCTASATTAITQPAPLLSHIIATNESTPGAMDGSADLNPSGGTLPYQFSWSNGASTEDITGLTGGRTYAVTITDDLGCQITDSVSIATGCFPAGTTCDDGDPQTFDDQEDGLCNCSGTPCPVIQLTVASTDLICHQDQSGSIAITPGGGVAPYSFLWTGGQMTSTIMGLDTGSYSVTVTDANGCTASATTAITQPAPLLSHIIATNESTPGAMDGSADLNPSGGTLPYQFSWSNGASTEDITGLTGGKTYAVTITDAHGCQITDSVSIATGCFPAGTTCDDGDPQTFDDQEDGLCNCSGTPCPVIQLTVASTDLICHQDQSGSIAITPGGGVAPYSFLWTGGQMTSTIMGLDTGSYSVTVTDANGCTASATTAITQPAPLLSHIIATNESTPGAMDGSADLNPSGGTLPYQFSWSNGASTEDITGLTGGKTYAVTITDAHGCQITDSVSIATGCFPAGTTCDDGDPQTFDDQEDGLCNCSGTPCPVIQLTVASTDLICHQDQSGSIAITPGGGVAPYSFLWTGGQMTSTIMGLDTGSYSVTVTDANGCTASATTAITQPAPLLSHIIATNESTPGAMDGSADLNPSGGTLPYQFSWSNGASTEDITGLTGGRTYAVTITDDLGCQFTDSVSIATGCFPAGTTCDDGDPQTFDDQEDGRCNCSGTPCPVIQLTVASTDLICHQDQSGSIAITPGGGVAPYSFLWTGGQMTSTIMGLDTGSYSVTVTDTNGCTASATTAITQPSPLLSHIIATNESTPGAMDGSADLNPSGGTLPYQFSWSNGASTEDITGLTGGKTYAVTITDAHGCQITDSVSIATGCFPAGTICDDGDPQTFDDQEDGLCNCSGTPCPVIQLTVASTDLICHQDQSGSIAITPGGGVAPYSFLWTVGQMTSTIMGLDTGSYSVTVTDANGCTASATTAITQPAPLLSHIIATNESTPGAMDGSADLNPSGGTLPYQFSWSNGASTEDITGLTGGKTYAVTITDAHGCQITDSVSIATGCFPAGTTCDDGDPQTFDDQEDGRCNCSGTPCPVIQLTVASTDLICHQDQSGSIAITPGGGVAPYSFLWTGGQMTSTIMGLDTGSYSVTVTDANGCTASATTAITQPAPLLSHIIGIDESTPGAMDGSADLNPSGGNLPYQFSWANGATTENITGLTGGKTYAVTITDAHGCQITDSVSIATGCFQAGTTCDDGDPQTFDDQEDGLCNCSGTPCPVIQLTVASTDLICHQDQSGSIAITPGGGVAPYSFLWTGGQMTSTIMGLDTGSYSVTVTDANGCTASATTAITQPAPLLSHIIATNESTPGAMDGSADLNPSGGTLPYQFSWSNGASTEDITGLTGGRTYAVTITDDLGCQITDSVSIATGCFAAGTICDDGDPQTFDDQEDGLCNCSGTSCPVIQLTVASTDLICHQDQSGSIVVSPSGGVAPYSFLWAGGQMTSTIIGLDTGSYSVTVTDANGCTASATAAITQPSPFLSHIIGTNESTPGAMDGSADLNPSGGTLPYQFSWSNGASTEDITGLTGGKTYAVTITDAHGCQFTDSVSIATGCFAAGTTCDDDDPQTFDDQEDGNCNCVGTPCQLPSIQTTTISPTCHDASDGEILVSLSGSSGYFFEYPTGDSTLHLRDLKSDEYVIKISNDHGCLDSFEVYLEQPDSLDFAFETITVSPSDSLSGSASVLVSGGVPPFAYQWSTGSLESQASGLANNHWYHLTVSDHNGCLRSDSLLLTGDPCAIIVDEDQGITIDSVIAEDPSDCQALDGRINIRAKSQFNNALEYSIDGGGTWHLDPNFTDLQQGRYSIWVRHHGTSCLVETAIDLGDPVPVVFESFEFNPPSGCNRSDGFLRITASSLEIEYSIDGGVQWHASPSFEGLSSDLYQVLVREIDASCTSLFSKTFDLNFRDTLIPPKLLVDHILCWGEVGSITIETKEGSPIEYWISGHDWQSDRTFFELETGIYQVGIRSLLTGCDFYWDEVALLEKSIADKVLVEAIDPSKCEQNDGLIIWDTTNLANLEFSLDGEHWINGNRFENLSPGTYQWLARDNVRTCLDTLEITLNAETDAFLVSEMVLSPSCHGGSDGIIEITLKGEDSLNYFWADGTQSISRKGLSAGEYHFTVTDTNGCSKDFNYILSNPPPLNFFLPGIDSTPLCQGELVNFTLTDTRYNYEWYLEEDFLFAGPRFSTTHPGRYHVLVIDSLGCQQRREFAINYSEEAFHANFLVASQVLIGESIIAVENSWPIPESIEWEVVGGEILNQEINLVELLFETPGPHLIRLYATRGSCMSMIEKEITVVESLDSLYMPGSGPNRIISALLSPNPNQGSFELEVELFNPSMLQIRIYNPEGQLIYHEQHIESIKYHEEIDLFSPPPGIYTLLIQTDQNWKSIQFVIQ